jgi:predicted metal-dependent phosphotriesterase family hydrolase
MKYCFLMTEISFNFRGPKFKFFKPLTNFERLHLDAVGAIHETSGLETTPVMIHPGENSKSPAEIMRILTEAGAKESKIVMGHLD